MLGIGTDRDLPTVLLIDDDMISREVVATLLTMNGYTLHTANSGAEALKMLDSGACVPQVILVDAWLDGLSGVVEGLRARTKACIYGISDRQPPEGVKRALDGFLIKPFAHEALQRLFAQDQVAPDRAAPDAAEPPVRAETLAQFRQMMPESAVRQIYTTVASDLMERSAALETAIAGRDAEEVRRIGHAIKGGCGMAGVQRAARLGAMLEAESDELNNSVTILGQLKDAAEGLKRMLDVEFPA